MIRSKSQSLRLPPGPSSSIVGSVLSIQKDAIRFALDCWREYGDIVSTRFVFSQRAVLLYHPDMVRYVLQHPARYDKRLAVLQSVQILMGKGLFTTDDEQQWRSQRRLIQPVFQQRQLPHFGSLITETIQRQREEWRTYAEQGDVVDIETEMRRCILRVLAQTLFSSDLDADTRASIDLYLQQMVPLLAQYMNFPFPPLSIPTPRNRTLQACVHALDTIIYRLIGRSRQTPTTRHDLLSLLIEARDEEGNPMSSQQVRDEVVTFLLGGHDTTAHTLAFTCYVLSQYPEVEEQVHAELCAVIGTRIPTMEDLPKLTCLTKVIHEVLRLYPPAFALVRRAVGDDEIAGYRIPRHSWMILIPYAVQRHPSFWEHPDMFDPERFSSMQDASFPRQAYMPFGAGPHLCVARDFGMMIVQLTLAMLLQHYHLTLMPEPAFQMDFKLSLRSRNGIPMQFHAW